jgi:hypothetical protein
MDPDPTNFFIDYEDAKTYFLKYFLAQAHHLQFKNFNLLLKFCRHYFSPLNTLMRKGKDPDPDPDPYL